MNMKKYNDFIIERKVSYKKKLCPDIWEDDVFISRIEQKLLRISRDFLRSSDIFSFTFSKSIFSLSMSKSL